MRIPRGVPCEIDHDDLWPRDDDHRFRIYSLVGKRLDVLAAAPTMSAVGVALATLHDDQKLIGRRLADLGQIGILDAVERDWILLPFVRGQRLIEGYAA